MFQTEFNEVESLIERFNNFLLIGHIDPDGDCIGSMMALALFLSGRGKSLRCFAPGGLPHIYENLPGSGFFVSRDELARFEHEVVFSMDSPTTARTDEIIVPTDGPKVVIMDHHPGNERYGDVNIVDEEASATAVIVYRFLSAIAEEEITRDIADCLFLGIIMDTGGFRFNNTNPESFRVASILMEKGARAYRLTHEFIHMNTLNGLRLLGSALASLRTCCYDKIAVMEVTQEMLRKNNSSFKDTEGFTDYINSIDGVEMCALFREIGDEETRVSLRSMDDHDVSRVAEKYGGGGHRRAAGVTIQHNLEDTTDLIIREMKELLEYSGS
jgi:phosphoesterase RecJ-like protein